MGTVTFRKVNVDGIGIFYRESGPKDAPAILLLHGFPTAGHMFRDLISQLAGEFRLIAPDLPGFGQSDMPARSAFSYTFENIAQVIDRFAETIGLARFAMYVFDYGAPVGFRLALRHPDRVTAIISQNGNAYDEGLSDGWKPIRAYWQDPSPSNREALRSFLAPETTRWQYTHGVPDATAVSPDGYSLDNFYLARSGADEVQLDLLGDYKSNIALYPKFQNYFRTHRPRLLAVWGKNDPFFLPGGAEAFKRDIPDANIRFFDTGHFALETHAKEIAAAIRDFLAMDRVQAVPSTKVPGTIGVDEYDLVVLGSGTGSKVAAWTLAQQGKRVALIERKYIGGSCHNIACLPSKNIIHSAKVASYVRRSNEFGIAINGFRIDMAAVRDRKRKMVSHSVEVHLDIFKRSGVDLILGSGRFIGSRTLEVAQLDGTLRRVRGDKVIISTGTRATLEAIPGLAESQPLTHIEALELDVIPEHLIVIGGGYVGLELSQAMRRFGSDVSVIDRNNRLLHREDEDVSEGLRNLFEDEGVRLVLNARVKSVSGKSGDAVQVVIEQNGVERAVEGSHLLVAAGRTPNTAGIGLESAGVELTERGYIKVNERLETTAPGVWALGEVAGSPQFTHISFDDFRVFRDDLSGGHHVTTGRQVPFCVFTDPEFARIGLSETEAQRRGIGYRLLKIPMEEVLRARTISETRGFLKALVEMDSDRILGFTGFAVDAGEIMGSVQMAMIAGLPYTALREAILTHPTLVEGLNFLFAGTPFVRNQSLRLAG